MQSACRDAKTARRRAPVHVEPTPLVAGRLFVASLLPRAAVHVLRARKAPRKRALSCRKVLAHVPGPLRECKLRVPFMGIPAVQRFREGGALRPDANVLRARERAVGLFRRPPRLARELERRPGAR